MANIIEYIRYTVNQFDAADFEAAYSEAAVPLAQSEHCMSYELPAARKNQRNPS